MFHAASGSSYSTGPNTDPRQGNFVRLVERHFISQIPSTARKPRPKGNVLDAQNLVFEGTHDFLARNVKWLFA